MRKIVIASTVILVLILLAAGCSEIFSEDQPEVRNNAGGSQSPYFDEQTLVRLSEVFGLSSTEFRENLRQQKTLSGIAGERSVPQQTVIDAIVAPYQDELKLNVEYGYLTSQEADARLEKAQEYARTMLDQDLFDTRGEQDNYLSQDEYRYYDDMMDGWDGMMGDGMGGGMMGGGGMGNGMGGMSGSGWEDMTRRPSNDADPIDWVENIIRGLSGLLGGSGGGMMGGGGMM